MCNSDVYRENRTETPKKQSKLKTLVKEDAYDVEYFCASARLAEVVEILSK